MSCNTASFLVGDTGSQCMCWVGQDYPPKYIWEPWKAPLSVQEAAGCIIGKDYPAPIVDHAEASRRYPHAATPLLNLSCPHVIVTSSHWRRHSSFVDHMSMPFSSMTNSVWCRCIQRMKQAYDNQPHAAEPGTKEALKRSADEGANGAIKAKKARRGC